MPTCPECGGTRFHLDEARSERVCDTCGLVLDAHVTTVPAPSHVEAAPGAPRSLGRLEKVQKHVTRPSSSEQRLEDARREAHRLGTALGCPLDIAEEASRLIAKARKAGLTQGRNLDALAAASLLASCRRLHFARKEDDVASAAKVPPSEIQAAYKALVQGLKLAVPAMTAFDYLAQIATGLHLPRGVEAKAMEFLSPICGTHHAAGKNPLGWAAAALVMAAREMDVKLSVNKVSKAAGVSGSTVQARLEDLQMLVE